MQMWIFGRFLRSLHFQVIYNGMFGCIILLNIFFFFSIFLRNYVWLILDLNSFRTKKMHNFFFLGICNFEKSKKNNTKKSHNFFLISKNIGRGKKSHNFSMMYMAVEGSTSSAGQPM
jgi:hypothetical protein